MLTRDEIARFAQDGYVAIDRLVIPDELLNLVTDAIGRRSPSRSVDQPVDEWLGVIGEKSAHLSPIVQHLRQIAGQLLGSTRPSCHFDHAISKPPQAGSRVSWHQDRASSLTGAFARSVHMWIPMLDANEENGCMHYIPGSHLGGQVKHRRLEAGRYEATGVNESLAVAVPVRRGGMTIHTPLTLHSSADNLSQTPRLAWIVQYGVGLAPKLRERSRPLRSAALAGRY